MSLCSAFSPAPGGSTFDPTNPGPIGGTTPDVGNFTRLNVSTTWNNAGTDFAGIYSRVTNTASGANSRLMSLGTVAGGELFGIVPNGNIMLGYDGHIKFNAGAADAGAEDVGIVRTAVGTLKVSDAGTGHGTLDVLGLAVSGAPGATYSGAVLSITVINGIVTAVT